MVLAVVVVALARQIGTLHLRLGPRGALEMDDEGPPLGEPVEPLELADVNDKPASIGGPGEAQLLLFVSPGCLVCEQVLPGVPAAAEVADLTAYVLTDLDRHETVRAYDGKRMKARLVPALAAAQSYAIPGTPYVVILDELGVVRGKGTVNNLEQLEGLVDTAAKRTHAARLEREIQGA
jgi:methylamine dehydrogenase accessory protein MauD